MILDGITRTLEIVLGEAHATAAADITACYADGNATSFMPGAALSASAGTTPVAVVAAPPLGMQRQVSEVRLHNNDTVPHTVTLRVADAAGAGTHAVILSGAVPPGGDFLYTPGGSGPGSSYTLTATDLAALNLSGLPATDPGGGRVWLNGIFLCVGSAVTALGLEDSSGRWVLEDSSGIWEFA